MYTSSCQLRLTSPVAGSTYFPPSQPVMRDTYICLLLCRHHFHIVPRLHLYFVAMFMYSKLFSPQGGPPGYSIKHRSPPAAPRRPANIPKTVNTMQPLISSQPTYLQFAVFTDPWGGPLAHSIEHKFSSGPPADPQSCSSLPITDILH